MKFTTLTVKRGTGANIQSIASGIVGQIDQQSLDMQNFDGGAAQYDLFTIEASTWLIKRNDHLIDENSTSDVYTVSARVETFPDGHSEFQATMPIGS